MQHSTTPKERDWQGVSFLLPPDGQTSQRLTTNAAEHVTNLFMRLLEIQFAVTQPYTNPS